MLLHVFLKVAVQFFNSRRSIFFYIKSLTWYAKIKKSSVTFNYDFRNVGEEQLQGLKFLEPNTYSITVTLDLKGPIPSILVVHFTS